MKTIIYGPLAVIALALSSCDSGVHKAGASTALAITYPGTYPIKCACTTAMVADIVKRVGADQVLVQALMGEGVDPHLYKASPGDVSKLNDADFILYSGLHLEGKMGDVLARMASKK